MLYSVVIILSILVVSSEGLILEGELTSSSNWEFIARFCYKTKNGLVDYVFEYPKDYCCQDAILYYDTQWDNIYPGELSMTCQDKVAVASRKKHQVLPLKAGSSACNEVSVEGVTRIVCKGYRTISPSIPRWWYLVISNCASKQGLTLRYKMVMTNGDSFWNKHFSADEQNILETDIFFLIVQVGLFFYSIFVAHTLRGRQLFHTTYKMYLWAIFLEILSIIVNMIYYIEYGLNGKPAKGVKNIGRGCHCIGDTIMVVLLILLGKGWTITRARISPSGQIKLSVFCTLYGIAYVALFIYEAKAFDPGQVLYIYESPAGVGLCVMKILAWIWFCYGVFFTLKNYADKRSFYFPFFSFYTLWFISGPIIVLIAAESIDATVREQTMNGVDRTVTFIAFAFFMILTRPSAANKNFPYHVRTTQIGFIDDSANPNFERAAYQPTTETVEFSHRLSLFSAVSENPYVRTGGGSSSPLNGSLSSTPIPQKSRDENDHTDSLFGRTNQGYSENDLYPPPYQKAPSPHPNNSLPPSLGQPPSYAREERPSSAFNASHFVTASGNLLNEKNHSNHSNHFEDGKLSKSDSGSSVTPLIRTGEEVTSLFQATAKAPSPPPITPLPRSNAPSPSFNIPEPNSKEEDPSSPLFNTHRKSSLLEPVDNKKPDFTNGLARQETLTENELGSGVGNLENGVENAAGDTIHSSRKKSKKKSKKKKPSNDPSNLQPIAGATVLPPLRGSKLPPLTKHDSVV